VGEDNGGGGGCGYDMMMVDNRNDYECERMINERQMSEDPRMKELF
jgi:hypothetical protein